MKTLGFVVVAAALAVVACSPRGAGHHDDDDTYVAGESPAASMTAAEASSLMNSMATPVPDGTSGLSGKWAGPEGTSMAVVPRDGGFDVTITNLDGPRTFHGASAPGGIAITRDGKALIIHRGSGVDTGMKWLADKKDCLVVDANEGYCRD